MQEWQNCNVTGVNKEAAEKFLGVYWRIWEHWEEMPEVQST